MNPQYKNCPTGWEMGDCNGVFNFGTAFGSNIEIIDDHEFCITTPRNFHDFHDCNFVIVSVKGIFLNARLNWPMVSFLKMFYRRDCYARLLESPALLSRWGPHSSGVGKSRAFRR